MTWRPDYVTAVELRDYLQVGDALDDAQLAIWVTAASRAVDKRCNRQFGKLSTAAARTYRRPAVWDQLLELWTLEVDDVQDITGLAIGGTAYASTGAVMLPDNAPADGVPYERIGFPDRPDAPVVVTAVWGWSAIPTQVRAAVYLQASRWNARRGAPLGVAGSPDSGSEVRLLARLDPDVSTTLAGLSRRRRAG